MATPNPNPTPKQVYQSDGRQVSAHRALVESPVFENAVNAALLQYSRQLAEQGGKTGKLLTGAFQFVDVLRNLGETPKLPKPPESMNLDHNV